MNYPIFEESLQPSLKLDGDTKEAVKSASFIISEITGMKETKVNFFINNFGLKTILDDPSIMGVSQEQLDTLKTIGNLIKFGGVDFGFANDNKQPVRY